MWQLIASVAAPGYTIHTVVAAASWALQRAEESAGVAAALARAAAAAGVQPEVFLEAFNKSVPTALGLLGETAAWQGQAAAASALRSATGSEQLLPTRRLRVTALGCSFPLPILLLPCAAIPFIVHPIDSAVHAALNATLRPAMRRYICREAGGAEAGLAICERCRD